MTQSDKELFDLILKDFRESGIHPDDIPWLLDYLLHHKAPKDLHRWHLSYLFNYLQRYPEELTDGDLNYIYYKVKRKELSEEFQNTYDAFRKIYLEMCERGNDCERFRCRKQHPAKRCKKWVRCREKHCKLRHPNCMYNTDPESENRCFKYFGEKEGECWYRHPDTLV